MNKCAHVWPVCPRPESDESLPSWFERVCHEYAMSPPLLLGVLEREAYAKTATPGTRDADRLHDSAVADRIAVLGQLSNSEINALWPPPTRWELQDRGFCSYCPYCCLDDLGHHRTPYGRRCWQQSWCTICNAHGAALVVRKQTHVSSNRSLWSHAKLKSDREFLAPDRYRDLKVAREPVVRSTLLGCLLHLERTTAAALSGIAPDAWSWGNLSSAEFLMILTDLTTWSLTHFESVRPWCAAEDLTPAEEQEGYGLIGRIRRMSASEYSEQRMTRTLREVAHPKVRGAALWAAHAFMATCHIAASDRRSGRTTQDRQAAWLSRSSPAARQWLALRQESWAPSYRRERWIDVRELT
jgi:hypothetical protein